jgi:hypothetical protein
MFLFRMHTLHFFQEYRPKSADTKTDADAPLLGDPDTTDHPPLSRVLLSREKRRNKSRLYAAVSLRQLFHSLTGYFSIHGRFEFDGVGGQRLRSRYPPCMFSVDFSTNIH